jgi:hypothetical protein
MQIHLFLGVEELMDTDQVIAHSEESAESTPNRKCGGTTCTMCTRRLKRIGQGIHTRSSRHFAMSKNCLSLLLYFRSVCLEFGFKNGEVTAGGKIGKVGFTLNIPREYRPAKSCLIISLPK